MAFTAEQRAKAAETRRANAEQRRQEAERLSSKIMSSGVGESRTFNDPQAADPAIADCHMGGVLIREKFPPETWHLIPHRQTDEGIAEFNRGKAPQSEFGNPVDRFDVICREGMKESTASWETPDPLKDTAAPHKRPGFVQRFLGKMRCDRSGLRKWQPVRDANGDLVRVGANLFLAEMPEDLAQKRKAAVAEETRAQRQEITEQIQTQQERFQRDSGLALKPGEILRDFQRPDAVAREGLHVRRGNTVSEV